MISSGFSLNGPLVVRSPNWLGDAVMAIPAVRNLKMMVNDSLTVATPEKLAALWQACPFVDKVLVLTQPKKMWPTAQQLRKGKFGAAVLLPNSLRSAAEAALAGIPERIGYARGIRGLLLTKTVPVPPRDPVRLHQRFFYLDLIAALGSPVDDTFPELSKQATGSSEKARPLIALCPGAEYGPAKRWTIENFLTVARHLISRYQARIVLLGAVNDGLAAATLAAHLPEVENRVGQTSLNEFLEILGGSQLVIGNDSGAMHVASALGVPTVAIFGSTEPALTGPLGPRTQVLRHHVPCSPCFLRECPIDFGCMRGVTPEMVIAAAETLL